MADQPEQTRPDPDKSRARDREHESTPTPSGHSTADDQTRRNQEDEPPG